MARRQTESAISQRAFTSCSDLLVRNIMGGFLLEVIYDVADLQHPKSRFGLRLKQRHRILRMDNCCPLLMGDSQSA
jgi:hypothetical protein